MYLYSEKNMNYDKFKRRITDEGLLYIMVQNIINVSFELTQWHILLYYEKLLYTLYVT